MATQAQGTTGIHPTEWFDYQPGAGLTVKWGDMVDESLDYVRNHPGVGLLAAFGTGMLLAKTTCGAAHLTASAARSVADVVGRGTDYAADAAQEVGQGLSHWYRRGARGTRRAASSAAEGLGRLRETASDRLDDWQDTAADRYSDLRGRASKYLEDPSEAAQEAIRYSRDTIREYPLTGVMAGLGVGVLIGLMIK